MEGERMKPALTPEEWAAGKTRCSKWDHEHGAGSVHRQKEYAESSDFEIVVTTIQWWYQKIVDPHGAAALCLHERGFGFTREDVDFLRNQDEPNEHVQEGLHGIADRIEALLPPEGT